MNNKKSLVALALVALIGIVGNSFAFFTSSTTINNDFTSGIYSTSIKEAFISPSNWVPGTTTEKKVNVVNNGTVEVAVRAKYEEVWISQDGTELSGIRPGVKVAEFTVGENWVKATDGWYYYTETLTTNEPSTDFISSVTYNPNFILKQGVDIECVNEETADGNKSRCTSLGSGYSGATYTLDITFETIQSDQKWSYTPSDIVYKVGDAIEIGDETFNILSDNGDTLTLLAAYNLGTNYKQTVKENYVTFSNSNGWAVNSDIDIQSYDGNAKTYVNKYVEYLQGITSDSTISGTLITKSQLIGLDCNFDTLSCGTSEHNEWISNGQRWWTSSANSTEENTVWSVDETGQLIADDEYNLGLADGIRPVITISKSSL